MTNAQKYEEIFGFPVDKEMCPTADCENCPLKGNKYGCALTVEWWDSEYKEPEAKNENSI